MRQSDTGACPGPSGWGFNYLSVLAADAHCVVALFVQFYPSCTERTRFCLALCSLWHWKYNSLHLARSLSQRSTE